MSDLPAIKRDIEASIAKIEGFANALPEQHMTFLTSELNYILAACETLYNLADASEFTEQPAPTVETLQESEKTEALDELLSEHPEKHQSDCAVHNMPAMEAGPCDCGGDDIVDLAVQATETIGSHSDISDEDMRATGGESVDSSTQTKIVGVTEPNYPNGLSATDFDFGPKA